MIRRAMTYAVVWVLAVMAAGSSGLVLFGYLLLPGGIVMLWLQDGSHGGATVLQAIGGFLAGFAVNVAMYTVVIGVALVCYGRLRRARRRE